MRTTDETGYLTPKQQDAIMRTKERMGEVLVPESEVTALKKENAKLRELGARLFDKMLELGTKNDRLRELVCHMHECMSNVDADGNHECFVCEYENADCEFDRRMRELGIEVS